MLFEYFITRGNTTVVHTTPAIAGSRWDVLQRVLENENVIEGDLVTISQEAPKMRFSYRIETNNPAHRKTKTPPPVPAGLPRNRKCDCGCRRPAAYWLEVLDLAFSFRCERHYLAAVDVANNPPELAVDPLQHMEMTGYFAG